MSTPASNPGPLRALLILHKAMLAGVVLFAIIAFYLVYSGTFAKHPDEELDKILQVLAIIFCIAGFYTGRVMFKRKIAGTGEMQRDTKEKLELYTGASIIQWAFIEVPSLFVIISFLLTGNYAFLILAAVLVLIFATMAPSKLKMAYYLQLSEEEKDGL